MHRTQYAINMCMIYRIKVRSATWAAKSVEAHALDYIGPLCIVPTNSKDVYELGN